MKIKPKPPGQINHPPELDAPTAIHPVNTQDIACAANKTPPHRNIF